MQYAALNPKDGAEAFGGKLTAELTADVPGQRPFQPTMKTFEAVMDHPPRARAAGMLHDTYFEVLTAVYRHGGKDAMFQFFAAFCAGMVLDELADLITDLRAVCFWKDADCTKIRPIGIGEALRRRICACIALQDRAVWDTFCTSLLPEDQKARDSSLPSVMRSSTASTRRSLRAPPAASLSSLDSRSQRRLLCFWKYLKSL